MEPAIEKPTAKGNMLLSELRAMRNAAIAERVARNKAAQTNMETKKEERPAELTVDGVNDDRYGQNNQRRVNHAPAVPNTVAVADVANVTHVPVSAPVAASEFEAKVAVVRDATIAAGTRRDIAALERGAAADARREGSYASTVVAALPTATIDANEVPLQGLVTRAVQANLAAQTGATAAHCPNVPGWDVRVGAVADSQTILRRVGHYSVLVIPHTMPQGAAEALASLMLPGGAAAYGWRFPADHAATGAMPSYVRWLYPGGRAQLLVLFEQPTGPYAFGGSALTVRNLAQLEAWMRREFGNEIVDQAYKTMGTAGHVYLDPAASDRDLGDNFGAVSVTTTRGQRDYAALQWTGQADHDLGNLIPRTPEVDSRKRSREMDDALEAAARALAAAPQPAPGDTVTLGINDSNRSVRMTWRAAGANQARLLNLDDVLDWVAEPDNAQPEQAVDFAMAWRTQDIELYAMYPDEQRSASNVVRQGWRNVFAFSDTATLAVPGFDIAAVAPVIAGVLIPTNVQRAATSVPGPDLRQRMRSYVAKAHVEHLTTMVSTGVWPDALDEMQLDHAGIVMRMAEGLQGLTYMSDAARAHLAASNWQLLESTLRLKGTTQRTPYVGYDVDGTWVVTDNGLVPLDDDKTNYAAVDAAARATWNSGGTFQASEAGCVGVLDRYGYVAPFALAPVVRTRRRLLGVRLGIGLGMDVLGAGHNITRDFSYAM